MIVLEEMSKMIGKSMCKHKMKTMEGQMMHMQKSMSVAKMYLAIHNIFKMLCDYLKNRR